MQLFWQGLTSAMQLLVRGDSLVLNAAWRSLWISVVAVLVAGIVGVPLAGYLAGRTFAGRRLVVVLFRAAMSVPTVLIGLLCYAALSRRGPLGALDMLYSPWGIVLGEFCLALPIIVVWSHGVLSGMDARVVETARTLGANPWRVALTCVSETRLGIALALLTAFARCSTELGIAMMVGGNIKYQTRTLTTATALETARGDFERGVAMSLLLLVLATAVTGLIAWMGRHEAS